MKRNLIGLLVTASLGLSVNAMAASGFYLGGGAGFSKASGSSLTSTSGADLVGVIGYDFNKYIGIEAELVLAGGWANGALSASATTSGASVTGHYPMNDDVALYVKIGTSSSSFSYSCAGCTAVSANANSVIYGFGGEFKAAENMTVRMGLNHYGLDTTLSPGSSANNFDFVFIRHF